MTCKDCIHYCVCKDTVAELENWTDEAPEELKAIFSPQGCENFATADVAPVKHGEWSLVWVDTGHLDMEKAYKCSCCGSRVVNYKYEYCPWCGTRMDGGK